MSSQYYIRLAGRIRGPFSLDSLIEQVKRGTVSIQLSEVSTDRRHWEPASRCSELSKAIARTPEAPRRRERHRQPKTPPAEFVSMDENASETHSEKRTDSSDRWNYTRNHQESRTTVTTGQLRELIRTGALLPDDRIWTASQSDWVRVRDSRFADELGRTAREDLSPWARSCVITGAVGYLMTLTATVMLIRIVRQTQLTFSGHPLVVVLILLALLLGGVTVWAGHRAISFFHDEPGTDRERNTIITGLSGGYTSVIVGVILSIASVYSATGESASAANQPAELADR